MSKFVIWALFDSGNGSYKQVADNFDNIEIFSIGIDRQNKNEHFINLDLADYNKRSNIPENLVKDIFEALLEKEKRE